MKETLEIGDELVSRRCGEIVGLHTIVRITKTQAITDCGIKFKRDCSNFIHEIGTSYYSTFYRFATEDDKKLIQKRITLSKIKSILDNNTELDLKRMEQILSILTEK